MPRLTLPTIGTAAVAAAAGWAFAGIPGTPVACPPAGCDCATAGAGPILQGANAWSSVAIAGAGIWMLSRPSLRSLDRLLAAAVVGSGTAAFLFHASLTDWAARADGIGVAAVAAVLAAREWSDRIPPVVALPAGAAAIAAAAAAGTPALNGVGALFGAAAAAGMVRPLRRRGRSGRLGWTAAGLLVSGAALWRLGRPGAAWCRPEAAVGPHAVWHLLVASALAAGFGYLRSGADSPGSGLLSAEATQQDAA